MSHNISASTLIGSGQRYLESSRICSIRLSTNSGTSSPSSDHSEPGAYIALLPPNSRPMLCCLGSVDPEAAQQYVTTVRGRVRTKSLRVCRPHEPMRPPQLTHIASLGSQLGAFACRQVYPASGLVRLYTPAVGSFRARLPFALEVIRS